MLDLQRLSSNLSQADDGIWYARGGSPTSYPPEGAERCAQIEDTSFWFRHRNQCIVALVGAYPPSQGGAIFDIGGGNGYVARGLADAGFELVLVEPSPFGARIAKQRGIGTVVCSTLQDAGFAAASLPAIGLFDVVEHIEDDASFMNAIHGLLAPAGRLYMTVPAYPGLWSAEDTATGHFRRYTVGSLTRLLESTGFKVEYRTYIFRLLPIPILLLRTLPTRLRLAKGPSREIARDHVAGDGITNRFLASVFAPEVRRIRRSTPMAFGASCLAVAMKM